MVRSPDGQSLFLRVPKCASTAASGFLCSQGWLMVSGHYVHARPDELPKHLREIPHRVLTLRGPTSWYRSMYQHVGRLHSDQPHPFQVYRRGHEEGLETWSRTHGGLWGAIVRHFLEGVVPISILNVETPEAFARSFGELLGVDPTVGLSWGRHNVGREHEEEPPASAMAMAPVLGPSDLALCERLDVDPITGPRWDLHRPSL